MLCSEGGFETGVTDMRKTTTFVAAVFAAAVFAFAAPSLFARGGSAGPAGSGGGDITSPGAGATGGPPSGGFTGSGGPTGNGPTSGPEMKRDGAEQVKITLDAIDRMARAEIRDFREERNRRAAQPGAGGADRSR